VNAYRLIAAVMVTVMMVTTTIYPAAAAPYISCKDGHIVQILNDCPIPRQPITVYPGGGSGGGGGGLLGTIGRLLGGLTGGLL